MGWAFSDLGIPIPNPLSCYSIVIWDGQTRLSPFPSQLSSHVTMKKMVVIKGTLRILFCIDVHYENDGSPKTLESLLLLNPPARDRVEDPCQSTWPLWLWRIPSTMPSYLRKLTSQRDCLPLLLKMQGLKLNASANAWKCRAMKPLLLANTDGQWCPYCGSKSPRRLQCMLGKMPRRILT